MLRTPQFRRLIFCALVFAAVYPLVTALSYLMQWAAQTWPIWQRHLVIVPIIVAAMMFIIIPAIHTFMNRWNRPAPAPKPCSQ